MFERLWKLMRQGDKSSTPSQESMEQARTSEPKPSRPFLSRLFAREQRMPDLLSDDYLYRLAEAVDGYFNGHPELSKAASRDRDKCGEAYQNGSKTIMALAKFLGERPALQARLSLLANYTPSRWLVEREIDEIRTRRSLDGRPVDEAVDGKKDPYRWMHENRVTGLCFSGGGIRSATFNLGLLQGMAEQRVQGTPVLQKFDYLSTVSGGGYIHEWLAAWTKREQSYVKVQQQLIPLPAPGCEPLPPAPLTWLRRYSNYLTPEMGFFTADTWVVAAIWLRNTFLNQLVLISGLLLIVLVPHLLTLGGAAPPGTQPSIKCITIHDDTSTPCVWINSFSATLRDRTPPHGSAFAGALTRLKLMTSAVHEVAFSFTRNSVFLATLAILTFLAGVVTMAFSLRRARLYRRIQGDKKRWNTSAGGGQGVAQAIVGCMLLSSLCITRLMFLKDVWQDCQVAISACAYVLLLGANITVSQSGGAREAFEALNAYSASKSGFWKRSWIWLKSVVGLIFLLSAVAAAGATGLFLLLRWIVCCELPRLSGPLGLAGYGDDPWRLALVAGPPLFLAVPFFSHVLLAGLIGRDFPDWLREWLASVRAWSLMIGLLWGCWFGISLLTRPALLAVWAATRGGRWAVLIGWIATTGASVLAGKSTKTNGKEMQTSGTSRALNIVATVGPYIFIVGLMILLSWAADLALGLFHSGWWYGVIYFLPMTVFALFGWRVDINEFSMHAFYRNRLTRCYLGATNPARRPNPLTGFDDRDTKDTVLSSFRAANYEGPFPIFCSTLNLTFGEDLAWQQRKAASFIFTPLYSGYHVGWTTGKEKGGLSYNGYVPTRTFAYPDGGINMATAVAISGAAVSPNWGYHTNPATAFLLTMFNVRLGWWLRNPRTSKDAGKVCSPLQVYDPDEAPAPRFPARQLYKELIGSVTDSSRFVYLTDGGHFENMGLYELVRRRCRFIVVCDAEEDHDYTFEGIGNAIQRCRIDFGVEIELNLLPLRPQMDRRLGYPVCKHHFVSGEVTYPERWGVAPTVKGKILYIKSSLTGQEPKFGAIHNLPGEPGDVVKQRLQCPPFPNDSTANQWFDEQTFESYRRLGIHVAEEIDRCGEWITHLP
jgi:hypothetical protein